MKDTTREMNMEQLDMVAGGTRQQTKELYDAIQKNPDLLKIYNRKLQRYGGSVEDTIHKTLLEAYGVLFVTCLDTEENIYMVKTNGVEFCTTHELVMDLIS